MVLSLTSTIDDLKYRELFRSIVPDKSLFTTSDGSLPFSQRGDLAPSAPNPQQIGTAFDYMMRAQVARWLGDPPAVLCPRTAEQGLFQLEGGEEVLGVHFEAATDVWEAYIRGKDVSFASLATACWFFAGLENLARSRQARLAASSQPQALAEGATPEQLADLGRLLALLEPHRTAFAGTAKRVYNPDFGDASGLVGGADADMIVDSTLIETKTSPNAGFRWGDVAQVVGYCMLAAMDGTLWPLTRLAIYRARYSRFEFLEVRKLLESVDMAGAAAQLLGSLASPAGKGKNTPQLKENALRNLIPAAPAARGPAPIGSGPARRR